jgi:hypothetical protein
MSERYLNLVNLAYKGCILDHGHASRNGQSRAIIGAGKSGTVARAC